MAFRFNFFEGDDNDSAAAKQQEEEHTTPDRSAGRVSALVARDYPLEAFDANSVNDGTIIYTVNGGFLSQSDSIAKSTDVLPKVYEGGFKIWECSYDSINYFTRLTEAPERLLDLGCGAGLVGIWALKKWQGTIVNFHDLNLSVVERSTIPNVRRNIGESELRKRSEFFYGPWDVDCGLSPSSFDLVSSADTLYEPSSLPALHDLLVEVLKPGGKAVIASKRFYFGVGGGVSSFLAIVNDKKLLKPRLLDSFEDGKSNIRDIVEFTKL
jgi:SAM-dependent methyltransferase